MKENKSGTNEKNKAQKERKDKLNQKSTRVEGWMTWFKNHPFFSVVIFAALLIIGIANVITSGEKIEDAINPKPKDQPRVQIDITPDTRVENIYKPFWELKHSDSEETKRTAFTKLLIQQDTKNFSGIRLEELDFSPPDGTLTVNSFRCKGCVFKDVQLRKIDWKGNLLFSDVSFRHVEFVHGTMVRPVFTNSRITNDYQDAQGQFSRKGFFQAVNIKNLYFVNSLLRNAFIIGFPERDFDQLDIETLANSTLQDIILDKLKISAKQAREGSFFNTTFNKVEITESSLESIDLSEIKIEGKLLINNTTLNGVIFSEQHKSCIEFSESDTSDVSWNSDAVGRCVNMQDSN